MANQLSGSASSLAAAELVPVDAWVGDQALATGRALETADVDGKSWLVIFILHRYTLPNGFSLDPFCCFFRDGVASLSNLATDTTGLTSG